MSENTEDEHPTEYQQWLQRVNRVLAARIENEDAAMQRPMDRLIFGLERLAIRTLRIATGSILVGLGGWALVWLYGISEMPFAQLTLKILGGGLLALVLGIWLLRWGLMVAFGGAPTREDRIQKWRMETMSSVK